MKTTPCPACRPHHRFKPANVTRISPLTTLASCTYLVTSAVWAKMKPLRSRSTRHSARRAPLQYTSARHSHPPSRPVYYLTESSTGSDFGGSLPNRTPYLGSLSDRMPPSLQGPAGTPLPPGSSTSSVFMPSLPHGHSLTHRGPGLAFPQTAPPHASSFPELAKITQGHIRTRSVQGEPPSATLLSPIDSGGPYMGQLPARPSRSDPSNRWRCSDI